MKDRMTIRYQFWCHITHSCDNRHQVLQYLLTIFVVSTCLGNRCDWRLLHYTTTQKPKTDFNQMNAQLPLQILQKKSTKSAILICDILFCSSKEFHPHTMVPTFFDWQISLTIPTIFFPFSSILLVFFKNEFNKCKNKFNKGNLTKRSEKK